MHYHVPFPIQKLTASLSRDFVCYSNLRRGMTREGARSSFHIQMRPAELPNDGLCLNSLNSSAVIDSSSNRWRSRENLIRSSPLEPFHLEPCDLLNRFRLRRFSKDEPQGQSTGQLRHARRDRRHPLAARERAGVRRRPGPAHARRHRARRRARPLPHALAGGPR